MNPERIRAVVRAMLDRGDLPLEKCFITWFGPGTGERCVVCGAVITAADIECECDHPRDGLLRFHQACFAAWDEARQDMAPA